MSNVEEVILSMRQIGREVNDLVERLDDLRSIAEKRAASYYLAEALKDAIYEEIKELEEDETSN